MVIKGRSRSNGVQLADYLLQSKENDRARIIDIRGTAQLDDLKKSLLEMSLSSELTKRGKLGLYHAQVNPAIGEDHPMTYDDWLKAADILEQHLGFDGQKRAIVLHEKNGRIHGHIVWEKYDHETGKLRSDSHNFKKHDQARAQIEQELGHERTPQRREWEPSHKERLTDLWQQHPDGHEFVKAAERDGYRVAQGNDRRPFRVVTPDGQSLDLTRQIDDIKKVVRERLQQIRADLPTEAEALQRSKADRNRVFERAQPTPERSDNSRELSDSQDRAEALKGHYKQQVKQEKEPVKENTHSPENGNPPSLPRQPEEKNRSDNSPELSDKQDAAAAMLERYRQRQAERENKVLEAKRQAAEQTKKREQGQSITDPAAEMLERYRQRQRERGRGGIEPEI
jgi:hypothetical protein